MGIELFERTAEARGRILKVERRVPTGGEDDLMLGIAFLLTFDVGRILVGFDGSGGRLALAHVEAGPTESMGLEDLTEEEPWWRVVGNPLCAVWPNAPGEAAESAQADGLSSLCLQFRESDEKPKLVALAAEAQGVRVSLREHVNVA